MRFFFSFVFSIPNDYKSTKYIIDELMMVVDTVNEGPASRVTGRKEHPQKIQLHQEILL